MQVSPEPVGVVGVRRLGSREGFSGSYPLCALDLIPSPPHIPREGRDQMVRGSFTQSTGHSRAGDTTAANATGSLPPDHFPPVGTNVKSLGQPACEPTISDAFIVGRRRCSGDFTRSNTSTHTVTEKTRTLFTLSQLVETGIEVNDCVPAFPGDLDISSKLVVGGPADAT
jgi:hypothetical protein